MDENIVKLIHQSWAYLLPRGKGSLLSAWQMKSWIESLPGVSTENSLAGRQVRTSRGGFGILELPDNSRLLIRPFRRGGAVKHCLKDTFFSPLQYLAEYSRPALEFRNVLIARSQGIRVPKCFGVAIQRLRGNLFYKGFIAYEYLEQAENLLDIASKSSDNEGIQELCFRAGIEARKLLEAGVMHTDLHLGNVLVRSGGEIWIIDFDKSYQVTIDATQRAHLMKQLDARWYRSVIRHNLSMALVNSFRQGVLSGGKEQV